MQDNPYQDILTLNFYRICKAFHMLKMSHLPKNMLTIRASEKTY